MLVSRIVRPRLVRKPARTALVSVSAVILAAGSWAAAQNVGQTQLPTQTPVLDCQSTTLSSPYIPVDSWIYPSVVRLYSLGYLDRVFLGMRPWTRGNVLKMLEDVQFRMADSNDEATLSEARSIYKALHDELSPDESRICGGAAANVRLESVYTRLRGISGTPLHDSYHLGSTIINDYGRPYENGANGYTGLSGYASRGRYTIYARGEWQGAGSAAGYSPALAQTLSENVDTVSYLNPATGLPVSQATIPAGPIGSTSRMRLMEAYVSAHVIGHDVSFGKHDLWLSPAQGASMAYSNNAENIYAFQINRTDPLRIPLISSISGPFRYDFLVGPLKGHTAPNSPWVHVEKVSFRPTPNLEFGFERTAIWGGKGHGPITLHTFLKSFFSFQNVTAAEKFSRDDPGARFGSFDFSYRPPLLRNWITVYSDSNVHDDVSPIDAPRRASWRPGIYLSHFPGIPKLDMRVEAASTDPPISNSNGGRFMYYEAVQKQGYTNAGQLFGDWIGREDKGGQAWITYHLSGNEHIQLSARNQKAAKDFIFGGTTINDFNVQVVKRIKWDLELKGELEIEHWKAPIYLSGQQTVTNTSVQLTWFPKLQPSF